MMYSPVRNIQPDYMEFSRQMPPGPLESSNSDGNGGGRGFQTSPFHQQQSSINYDPATVIPIPRGYPVVGPNGMPSHDPMDCSQTFYPSNGYGQDMAPHSFVNGNMNGYVDNSHRTSPPQEGDGRITPEYTIRGWAGSPPAEPPLDLPFRPVTSPTMSNMGERTHPPRRGTNRDEFDGPHQILPKPPLGYLAEQDRDLPHLPTNLVVQEQDAILTRVNDRLSRCAFDFVAKYEFPIPIDSKMRPVERPEDREWTEWVYLLKRLATKRRIPARVLYNGQIKQLVTILENSLEMKHAARNQSRPLKDDRNMLQLISAGIQVAKILKDASAMDYLDRLYVATERQIQERSQANSNRYR